MSNAEADARVVLTLLHLRDAVGVGDDAPNIVVELLDERDAALTDPRPNDEFIVSERLAAMMLAQYSQTPDLYAVFDELLDQRGVEIYLKAGKMYSDRETATFADIVAGAAARGEVAIGYQLCDANSRNLVVNPPKAQTVHPRELRVAVLAQEAG